MTLRQLATLTAVLPLLAQQVPGFAEIDSPAQGQAVAGVVTIAGTADHPAFERYELAFGYDPDPTDSWFPIGEPMATRVIEGRLALWDTTAISDGQYRLRLRVWLEEGRVLEAIITDVRVRNYHPTETPPPALADSVPMTPTPSPTPAPLPEPAQPPDGGSPYLRALATGGLIAVLALASLGMYAVISPAARAHLAYLRMRRLHRRIDQARSRARRQ